MERIRTADVLAEAPSFRDLLLPAPIVKSLEDAGYLRPSPVQHAAIPLARLGLDVIIQAKAGTGKTLVFAVTMTELIDRSATFPQVLVLAPTREVALQAADVITEASAGTPPPALSVATLIGGLPTAEDERILRRKCHVIVGTPGRVLSLIQRGSLVTQGISMLVLDEADKLLGPDFWEVVSQVIDTIPPTRQILALSATYTPAAAEQLKVLMRQPHEVMLCAETTSLLGIAHYYKLVAAPSAVNSQGVAHSFTRGVDTYALKRKTLLELLSSISFHQAVVFCNSKATADTLAENLITAGHAAACLSSDKDQLQRIDVLNSLRSFGLRIVVATDVAARGIDLDRVNLVVNFDLPASSATLMHRVGRAGRFGTHGTAISLVYGQAELDDLHRAVTTAAGGDVYPLPDELPLGWSAAQLLDVAAVKNKANNEKEKQNKQKVKVISCGVISPSSAEGAGNKISQSNVSGSDSIGGIENSSIASEFISSVSLWPEEQGVLFPQPENKTAWPLQLAEFTPARQQQQGNKKIEGAAKVPQKITEEATKSLSQSEISSGRHYSEVVRSLKLDLQRTTDTEAEAVEVLEQAFSFKAAAATTTTTEVARKVETNFKAINKAVESEIMGSGQNQEHGEHDYHYLQHQKLRRPLGSAQVSAYSRQRAQEEHDYHRALAEEAAFLESMAFNAAAGDGNVPLSDEDDEFDEYGYYTNPRGQYSQKGGYSYPQQQNIEMESSETENLNSSSSQATAIAAAENEAVWRQYWYDHYNQYGYWPGGKPSTLQIPSSSPLPEAGEATPAAAAAYYSVTTPGSAEPTTTSATAAPTEDFPLTVGGWSPSTGEAPNTAAVVASCADQGGYVRVPAQILQRYLELEWQQWQNRFFGGGSGGSGN